LQCVLFKKVTIKCCLTILDQVLKLSNDVWKNKRIGEAVKKRKSLGEETKQRIFLLMFESEPKGMTTDELVKATGRDRRTIHGKCRDFQKKGLIKTKTGRYEKYHLSSKGTRTDDPSIGPFLLQFHMLGTQLFELGEVALSSSMEFLDSEYSQRILNYKMGIDNTKEKEALKKFYLFEFALRWGSLLLYILIQSMKYAQPSLHINDSMREHLKIKRLESAVSPFFLGLSFEQLLLILDEKIWKGQKPAHGKKMESIDERIMEEKSQEMEGIVKKLMEERFEEMEDIYKKTFPIVFELIEKLQYDMVYEHGILPGERDEQQDPNHIKCEGELMPMIYVGPDGRKVKQCSGCKRLIPVEDSQPPNLES
jgi:hypothetical protein